MFDKGTLQEVHSMGVTLCAVGASQLGVLLRPKTCLQGGLKVACDERGTKSLLDIIPVSRDALPGCATSPLARGMLCGGDDAVATGWASVDSQVP